VTIDGKPPARATGVGDHLRVPHVGGRRTFGWGRATQRRSGYVVTNGASTWR
jgi:hypothetical protein